MPTIVIVGAGPGLGLSIGKVFGRNGYTVALIARDQSKLDALAAQLREHDIDAAGFAADIMDRGIVLAGGGALLHGMDERLRHETQMPVHLAESPLTCVAVGSGRSLEEFEAIHRSNRSRARRNGRVR